MLRGTFTTRARRLASAASAAAVATLAALATGCGCTEVVERTFIVNTPAEPTLQFKLEACRVDPETCNAVCIQQLAEAGLVGDFVSCKVTFTAGRAEILAAYDAPTDGLLCP
jgi:hypothetical protein